MKYTTEKNNKTRVILIIVCAVLMIAAFLIAYSLMNAAAESYLSTCWAMCKPGAQVNVRRAPDGGSKIEGFLEAGDTFLTDGTCQDGWVKAYGIGEAGEGWVYAGYVSTEEPRTIMQQYVCVAKKQVACRRWIHGPQIEERKWLKNGENVTVFYIGDGWAVTSRGYIQSEWLEADPL